MIKRLIEWWQRQFFGMLADQIDKLEGNSTWRQPAQRPEKPEDNGNG